jgi:hypothetical protein
MLGRDAHSAEVNWQISTSGGPHMFILGIPGQGKSVTTRRILNSFADQGLPALVVDFHGDMAADPAADATVVDAADGLDFSPFELRADVHHQKYAQAAWELAEVVGYVSGLGEIQRNVVYEALRELYQRHGFGSAAGPTGLPTMAEFAKLLEQKESSGHGRNVAARTRPLSDFGPFRDDAGERRFGELLDTSLIVRVGAERPVRTSAGTGSLSISARHWPWKAWRARACRASVPVELGEDAPAVEFVVEAGEQVQRRGPVSSGRSSP